MKERTCCVPLLPSNFNVMVSTCLVQKEDDRQNGSGRMTSSCNGGKVASLKQRHWTRAAWSAAEEQATRAIVEEGESQLTIWSFTVFPSSSMVRILKSTPMVLM